MYTVPQQPVRRWYQRPAVQVLLGLLVTLAAGASAEHFSSIGLPIRRLIRSLGWAGNPPNGVYPPGVWVGLVVGLSQVLVLGRTRWWVKGPWVLATMVAASTAYYTFVHVILDEAWMGFIDPPAITWELGLKAGLVPGMPLWVIQGVLLIGTRRATVRWRMLGMIIGWLLLWLILTTLAYTLAWEQGGGIPPGREIPLP